MKTFVRAYFKISGICVGATLLLESWVLKLLFDAGLKTALPGFLVAVLGGGGVYFLLYKVVVWFYEKWAWRHLFRSLCIDGTWYHTIECESRPDYKRYGRT
jgi:hypothetical protein